MSNFIVPDPPARDRRSALNDLGFGTILGNGSSVSPDKELETLLKMDHIQSRLEEQGVREIMPEIAIHRGEKQSYDKGYSKLDVLELHNDYLTVCVYDFKTGRTPPRLETIYRHIREGGLYAIAQSEGYRYVYFIPIFVH